MNRAKYLLTCIIFILSSGITQFSHAQPVPGREENIKFLAVAGEDFSSPEIRSGDEQSVYFIVPVDCKEPFYLRIFDADVGGENDIAKESYNTTVKYEVFVAKLFVNDFEQEPVYEQVYEEYLTRDSLHDDQWKTLCALPPYSATDPFYESSRYKFTASVVSGNDLNSFRLFLSTSSTENSPIEGANSYRYESNCLLHPPEEVSHIYPYIHRNYDTLTTRIEGWKAGKRVQIVSAKTHDLEYDFEGSLNWRFGLPVFKEDVGGSLDLQILTRESSRPEDYYSSFIFLDEFGLPLKCFSYPIGGLPRYQYSGIAIPID